MVAVKNWIYAKPKLAIDGSLRLSSIVLIAVGASLLIIGIGMSAVGGAGELAWYQCVASSSGSCITSGSINNQYYTVFLANNDLMSVGFNILLVGVLVLLAGIVTSYMPAVSRMPAMGASLPYLTQGPVQPSVNPVGRCAKCGTATLPDHKFCAVCGNPLS